MTGKLSEAEKRYDEISEKLSDPEIISDQGQYTALMKEYKQLLPIVEAYRSYSALRQQIADALER